MKLLILLFFTFMYSNINAQTWSSDVAQIVYNKCTKCHHVGGVAPFPLMTYAETSPMTALMQVVVSTGQMPPWPPEDAYQQYAHKRSLDGVEKTTILNWIANGSLEGDPLLTPPPPVYSPGSLLGNGDLEIQIPTYMSKASATNDDYVCFALPSNLAVDRQIKSVEIIPGNPAIVHHALVFIDPSGNSITDTIGGDCGGPNSPAAKLVMGYTPGSSPMALPATNSLKLGIPFPANSQVLFNLHYPEGSYGMYDSTKVIFHFYPIGESGVRDVFTNRLLENWTFVLPPNQITNVNAQYPPAGTIPADYSLLSVFPHMHLLGKSMRVYGIQPSLDTMKLINIPQWDFEWQDFYFYKYLQKAQAGSILKLEASFDNTSSNLFNPNSPPITVYPGLNTTDEMCLVYMHYLPYQAGDENYNIDSLMSLNTASLIEKSNELTNIKVFPNPFDNDIVIQMNKTKPGDIISLSVYDIQGNLVEKIESSTVISYDNQPFIWKGGNIPNGVYILSVNLNGTLDNQRIIKN